jgi:cyclase
MDVKKKRLGRKYVCFTNNGRKNTGVNPIDFALLAEENGAGEILVNSIDHDGVMKGYDLDIIHKIKSVVNIPVTAIGGAGTLEDLASLISHEQIIGAAAGSLFVFKGKYKAVLINYPSFSDKEKVFREFRSLESE